MAGSVSSAGRGSRHTRRTRAPAERRARTLRRPTGPAPTTTAQRLVRSRRIGSMAGGSERGWLHLRQPLTAGVGVDLLEALANRVGIFGGQLDAHPAPLELVRHRQGGSRAREWIEHQVPRVAGDPDDALQDSFGHLAGMSGAFLECTTDPRDKPGVGVRAEETLIFLRTNHPGIVR